QRDFVEVNPLASRGPAQRLLAIAADRTCRVQQLPDDPARRWPDGNRLDEGHHVAVEAIGSLVDAFWIVSFHRAAPVQARCQGRFRANRASSQSRRGDWFRIVPSRDRVRYEKI